MRIRKARFKLRSLMIAVAITALVLTVEPILCHQAAKEALDDDGRILWGTAVTNWLVMNGVLAITIGLVAAMLRDTRRHDAGASESKTGV